MSARAAVLAGTFALGAILSGPVLAASPSGEVVAVTQTATAGSRALAAKGPVFTGDVVATDRSGEAQLLFRDNTKLVVGPDSQITIDSFVFQASSGGARKVSIGMAKGALRFITGKSAKQAYSITTPTATIGVRGTEFDLTLGADGATNLALYGGGVRVCDLNGRCTELTGTCSIVIVAPGQDFQRVNNIYQRTAMMETTFPYAFRQSWLREDFRVQSRSCNNQDMSPNAAPGNGAPAPSQGEGEGGG